MWLTDGGFRRTLQDMVREVARDTSADGIARRET